jgi:DNA-directed RNA polymerase specialized sigma24 family protein
LNLFLDECRQRQVAERLQHEAQGATSAPEPDPPDNRFSNLDAAARREQLLAALTQDAREVFKVWVEQHAGHFSRAEAASRLNCSIDDFEAAKKRVRREIENLMERLHWLPGDLMSELPLVANSSPTRNHREEGGE